MSATDGARLMFVAWIVVSIVALGLLEHVPLWYFGLSIALVAIGFQIERASQQRTREHEELLDKLRQLHEPDGELLDELRQVRRQLCEPDDDYE